MRIKLLFIFLSFFIAQTTSANETESIEYAIEAESKSYYDGSLWVGAILGLSIFEESTNNRNFEPGFAGGIDIQYDLLRVSQSSFGIGTGYLFFSNVAKQGTEMIGVKTGYNRFNITATATFDQKALVLYTKIGTSMTVISNEIYLTQNGETETSSNRGISPGFLGVAGIGVDLGKYILPGKRGLRLLTQFDWSRRGRRDEFAILFLINVELFKPTNP